MADSVIERKVRRPSDESLDELRSIIVGPEQRELLELQSHLLDPAVQTRDVSRVLPEAIALRATDPQLTHALAPTIEEAVTASVRRDPRPLADALFPVMGPAIRKAIAHTLSSMMESLGRTIEYSLSWRALRWRWTALRTGKPFAEIVLLNTLQYRVEQVFLIHAETGLLLQHVTQDRQGGQEADQISAMLTAIRDFVRDSFRTSDQDSVDALRVGDLSVFVEQGPMAFLAGVVRGVAPATLHATFADALERIHGHFGADLEVFQGDAAPFERAGPILETCLVSQFRGAEKKGFSRRWTAAAVVVLLAIVVWGFFAIRGRMRWSSYLDSLRAQPGIVVVTEGRRAGRFFVSGMRDPLSVDPASLLVSAKLSPSAVDAHWEPFDSLQPDFVTARARNLLRPPAGVTLSYRAGMLTASGAAPSRWIIESERLAPAMAGVRRFVYDGPAPEEQVKARLEAIPLLFPKGQSRLAPGQDEAVLSLRHALSELNDIVRMRGTSARVEITGHTDADGSERANGPLSQARAERALELLRRQAFDGIRLTARGVGSAVPLTPGATELEKQRNRRASFRLVEAGTAPERGRVR